MSRIGCVADALALARERGLERLDAQLIVGQVLGQTRAWVLTHDDAPVPPEQAGQLGEWIARRADGEPFAYLTGEQEFHGLRLQVSPAVLVPRPDTETLVDWALALLADPDAMPRPFEHRPRVLDLGTGSGAIALAVRHRHAAADVTATDFSADALAVARANAERLQLPVRFVLSDWWQSLAGEPFDLVLSNPPYIADGDSHLAALTHEPAAALTPGGDGLDAYRTIIVGAARHLSPRGWLVFEHGHDQASAVAALLRAHGFAQVQSRPDLAGIFRCTGGRCIGASAG